MIAAASIPGSWPRTRSSWASSSSSSGVVKLASWSARKTANSWPGLLRRVATTARQARAVALIRAFGAGENGIP